MWYLTSLVHRNMNTQCQKKMNDVRRLTLGIPRNVFIFCFSGQREILGKQVLL